MKPFDYDVQVLRLASNLHNIVQTDVNEKKASVLKHAINLVSKLYNKPFNDVYNDVSDYAGWMTVRDAIEYVN